MSSLKLSRIPYCTQCLRSYAFSSFPDTKVLPFGMIHTRGKAKMKAKKGPEELVRLLKPMKGIGRKGAIVTVAVREMNRVWIPHRIAIHLTAEEMRQYEDRLEAQSASVASTDEAPVQLEGSTQDHNSLFQKSSASPERIRASESRDVLERLVPDQLDFYRKVVPRPRKEPTAEEKEVNTLRGPASELLLGQMAEIRDLKDPDAKAPQAIFGAVTTLDIRQAILDLLAQDSETSRVTVEADNIKFLELHDAEEEGAKVKHLGRYRIEIAIPGEEQRVQRTVRVRSEEEQKK